MNGRGESVKVVWGQVIGEAAPSLIFDVYLLIGEYNFGNNAVGKY